MHKLLYSTTALRLVLLSEYQEHTFCGTSVERMISLRIYLLATNVFELSGSMCIRLLTISLVMVRFKRVLISKVRNGRLILTGIGLFLWKQFYVFWEPMQNKQEAIKSSALTWWIRSQRIRCAFLISVRPSKSSQTI